MMLKAIWAGSFAALLAVAPSPVVAAPEDDFVVLMTAVEIDKTCIVLKYVETAAVRTSAFEYLRQTSQYAHTQDGRMTEEDYKAWEAGLWQQVRDNAAAAGCGDAALPSILAAKAKAAEQLYQGLYLAFMFDSLTDEVYRRPLDDYEKQSAMGYEGYLQQLYGESFDGFAGYQQEQARLQVPGKILDHLAGQQPSEFDELYEAPNFMILDLDESTKMGEAQSNAVLAVNQVQFEVTAEVNNFIVRPLVVADGNWVIPELRRPAETEGLPVVKGPVASLIDVTPAVEDDFQTSWQNLYWVAVMRPDNGLRIMFYGQTAMTLSNPVVRIYARNAPLPEGTYAWQTFDAPAFRDTATAYEPTAVTEGCLGGPCFDFSPEVTEALLAYDEDNIGELYVATAADTPYPFSFRQGRLDVSYLWSLAKGAP